MQTPPSEDLARDAPGTEPPQRSPLHGDPHRPRYHFLPPANWINDPNGLIQWNGQVHLFYQYNPLGPWHERIHWGHAVSRDLLHWQHLPLALVPRPGEHDADGCWSGCAVDDAGTPTIFYTGVFPQVVNKATSRDGLLTWQKDRHNPVLAGPPAPFAAESAGHFRDPFVWREDGEWRMVIGCKREGVGGAVLQYRSADLRTWAFVGPFLEGDASSPEQPWSGTMWECPNLLRFGDRSALLVSPQATPTDHLEPVWHTGPHTLNSFHSKRQGVLVHGRSYYAPQVLRLDDERYIMWGWLKEARSDDACLRAGWNGLLSLPTEVSLDDGGAIRLAPARELETLRRLHRRIEDPLLTDAPRLVATVEGSALELVLEAELGDAAELDVVLGSTPDAAERTVIRLSGPQRTVTVEREHSSASSAVQRWPVSAPLQEVRRCRLHIFLDGSVLEIFAGAGDSVLATRIYPEQTDSTSVSISCTGAVAKGLALDIWSLASVWE